MRLSCTVFWDIIAYFPKGKEVTWQWPRPFQGWFVICRLGLAMFKPHTKFEMFTIRPPATKKWKETPNVKNSRFEPPFPGLRGNAQGSSMAWWKAHCRLPITDDWTFLASSHGCGTIKWNLSKSAFSEGDGSLSVQILGRWGRRPQSVYGPLDRGMM